MVGCCRGDSAFSEMKVYFLVAVQTGSQAAVLYSDPGSFHHLLQCISPPLWLSSSLFMRVGRKGWGGVATLPQGNDVQVRHTGHNLVT